VTTRAWAAPFPACLLAGTLLLGLAACGGSHGAADGGVPDGGADGPPGGDGAPADGAGADAAGPCAGVSCGGHGQCAVVGGAAACQCDTGYHTAGLECVADDVDCASATVHCVDDTAGPTQEYATIQAAVDAAQAGDLVLVFDGSYAGFQVTAGGTAAAPLVIRASGTGAVVDRDGPTGDGIRLENVSYVTVAGFSIRGVTDRGIAHRGATPEEPVHGLLIRGNTIEDSGTEGMYLSEVADSLIEGNTIRRAGASGADLTHGIYLANAGSKGTTLRGNVISGSGTAGIHFNGDLSIGGDGIISGLTVENNVIFDNTQNGLNMDGVQDSVIRNNVIHGNGQNGIRAYAIDAAAGPKGLVIVNNTIHVPSGAGWCVRLTEDSATNVVFNNILINEDPDNGSIALDDTAGFASASNAVVDGFTPDRDATYLTLAEWQALGYDAGSFVSTAAALFTSPATGDYTLLAGAPALGAGLASFAGHSAPATDLRGNARNAPIDLGAYER
jgi:hypothetical protein